MPPVPDQAADDEPGLSDDTVELTPSGPVFVDPTGRRRRIVRRVAVGACVLIAGYVALLCAALLGAPVPSSVLLPLPQAPDTPAATTTPTPSTTTEPAPTRVPSRAEEVRVAETPSTTNDGVRPPDAAPPAATPSATVTTTTTTERRNTNAPETPPGKNTTTTRPGNGHQP